MDQQAIASPPSPGSFTFEGKTYQFAHAETVEVIQRFERWMKEQAFAELRSAKEFMTASEYAEAMEGLRRDITAKRFSWWGPQRAALMNTGDGQKQILSLMVKMHHTDISADLFDRIYASADAERIVNVMLGQDDPKPKTPATTTSQPANTTPANSPS